MGEAQTALTSLHGMFRAGQFALRSIGLVEKRDDILAPPGINEDTFNRTIPIVENHLRTILRVRSSYPTVNNIQTGNFNSVGGGRRKSKGCKTKSKSRKSKGCKTKSKGRK